MSESINEQTLTGGVVHEWTIQEYDQHERGRWWYIIMITLGLILVLYGVLTGNFLFSLIIILFAIILFLQSHQTPAQLLFQITDLGVIIGSRFFNYSEFENFYIIYNPPETKTLFFATKSAIKPLIRVSLLDNNPIEIKSTLREYLPEDIEKEEEPLTDRVARNFRIH